MAIGGDSLACKVVYPCIQPADLLDICQPALVAMITDVPRTSTWTSLSCVLANPRLPIPTGASDLHIAAAARLAHARCRLSLYERLGECAIDATSVMGRGGVYPMEATGCEGSERLQ